MKKLVLVLAIFVAVAALADNPHITALAELADVLLSSPTDGQVLTFDAAADKWENKSSPSNVVASQSFINQTADIPLTTIYTPVVDGNYRISEYGDSNVNANVAIFFVFSWTDEVGLKSNMSTATASIPAQCCGSQSSFNSSTLMVHAKASTPITVMTCMQPSGGGLTCGNSFSPSFFDAFITVERLN